MPIADKPSSPQITENALRLPADFPELPDDVLQRFDSLNGWQDRTADWWRGSQNAINEFAQAIQDQTSVGGVLSIDGDNGAIFIRKTRGDGAYDDPDTAFFVNDRGYFSLSNRLTWNPDTKTLTVEGTIIATAGEIGGFIIGSDFIRDTLNSMGLSSTVTGGDDVRFWAGDTFANRAAAPFRVYESGAVVATNATITGSITATSGSIGGFNIGSDYIRDAANSFGLASTITGGNDVRFWAGAAFASRATAPFRVYEDGTGMIGGFTISTTKIYSGSGSDYIEMNPDADIGFLIGSQSPGPYAQLFRASSAYGRLLIADSTGSAVVTLSDGASGGFLLMRSGSTAFFNAVSTALQITGTLEFGTVGSGDTNLYRSAANTLKTDDDFIANSFSGSGASLTSLNASNIASGTIDNARLPSAISVTSLTASGEIRGATARFGTFTALGTEVLAGFITYTDAGGASRKLGVIA